jgi:hypothetical protein
MVRRAPAPGADLDDEEALCTAIASMSPLSAHVLS